MEKRIPQLDKINQYKFYNLYVLGWEWDKSSKESSMNRFILEEIANDCSNDFDVPAEMILDDLEKDSISTRSTEHLLYMYTCKDSKSLSYYLTNVLSDTFKILL